MLATPPAAATLAQRLAHEERVPIGEIDEHLRERLVACAPLLFHQIRDVGRREWLQRPEAALANDAWEDVAEGSWRDSASRIVPRMTIAADRTPRATKCKSSSEGTSAA